MKKIRLLFLSFLIACAPQQEDRKPEICDLKSTDITRISQYLFSQELNDILKDSCIKAIYTVKREREQAEGLVWPSISFYRRDRLQMLVESDWTDSVKVSRITFYSDKLKLNNKVYAGAKFKDVLNFIDTVKRKNYLDGTIEFYMKGDSNAVVSFDVSDNPKLYFGYNHIKEIPDTLKVQFITIFQ